MVKKRHMEGGLRSCLCSPVTSANETRSNSIHIIDVDACLSSSASLLLLASASVNPRTLSVRSDNRAEISSSAWSVVVDTGSGSGGPTRTAARESVVAGETLTGRGALLDPIWGDRVRVESGIGTIAGPSSEWGEDPRELGVRECGDFCVVVDRWLPFAGFRIIVDKSSGRSRWNEGWWNSHAEDAESVLVGERDVAPSRSPTLWISVSMSAPFY